MSTPPQEDFVMLNAKLALEAITKAVAHLEAGELDEAFEQLDETTGYADKAYHTLLKDIRGY